MILDPTSLKKLKGVHPDLVKVVMRAAEITTTSFCVVYGVRTIEAQKEAIRTGHSSLKDPTKSRHIPSGNPPYAHAVDLALWINGKPSFEDDKKMSHFIKVRDVIHKAGDELGIHIRSGADWIHFKDWGHHELLASEYP